jgi:hypothetical protein
MIFVAHVAVEHVSDGLEASVRMCGEACDVVVWVIRIELIEHQERIHVQPALTTKAAAQLDAGAI